jgi:hypothetical protein
VIRLPLQDEEERPTRFRWNTSLTANEDAHRNARLRVLPALHVADWPGNSDVASRLSSVLVGNAAAHAEPMSNGMVPLRLIELSAGELAIEVDDGTPEFPNFAHAVEEAKTKVGSGLWWVSHYRACPGRS